MADRVIGATRCAHCRAAEAVDNCSVCRNAVCAACAADWTTCPEPVGRELRLGMGRRLRFVTANGRLGLVRDALSPDMWVDFRHMRWTRLAAPAGDVPHGESHTEPQPMPGRRWIGRRRELIKHGKSRTWRHLGYDLVDEEGAILCAWTAAPELPRWTLAPDYSLAWAVSSDQRVCTFELEPPYRFSAREVLPGHALQAFDFDVAAGLAAAGTWGGVTVYRTGETWSPAGQLDVDADVGWVGIAGGRVAVVVDRKRSDTLKVWAVDADGKPNGALHTSDHADGLRSLGAITPDGRHLALATARGDRVLLFDLELGDVTELGGHTDDVCLIAFVDNGQRLITADCDNRVIIRPRTDRGYAEQLRPAALD